MTDDCQGSCAEPAPAHPEPTADRPRGQHHPHGARVQESCKRQGGAGQVILFYFLSTVSTFMNLGFYRLFA